MRIEPDDRVLTTPAGDSERDRPPPVSDETVGVAPTATTTPFHRGSPAAVGVPTFIVGSVALGLALVGYVTGTGAALPIILAATGIGQLVTCIWSIGLGETVVASIFGIFGGFWLSYAALVLGLTHGWFGIATTDVVHAQGLFLISWLVVIVMLTLASLRLPLAFTAIFVLVDVALALVLAGTLDSSTGLVKAGGVVVFCFAAVGALVYVDTMSQALGGRALPLGPAVQKG